MKKKIIITILSVTTALIGLTVYTTGCKQEQKIAELETKIDLLKAEYTPMRFKILDRKNNNIKVAIKFYNAQGKSINRMTKILPGNELSFDFYVIPIGTRHLFFPLKIFTDKIPPAKGTQLTNFYDKSDFPAIYETAAPMDKKLYKGLKSIFQHIKDDDFDADDQYFGSMVHDITKLKKYKTNTVYRIVCRSKGGMEVIED